MNLHGDDAGARHVLLCLREVHGLHAIEPDLNARALCADAIGVPFAQRFLGFLQHLLRRLDEDFVAAAFVVERAIVARAEVGLIAGDLVVIRMPPAAELHASIHESFGAGELPLHAQVEVPELLLRAEEFILWLALLHTARGEGPLLYPPGVFRVALPAIEGAVGEGISTAERAAGEEIDKQ